MNPADYRNATWDEIQQRIEGLRLAVYRAWLQFGPGTTREIAAAACMDILTFRPRSTELFQMGLLRLVDREHDHAHQGTYAAVPLEEARVARLAQTATTPEQMLMPSQEV